MRTDTQERAHGVEETTGGRTYRRIEALVDHLVKQRAVLEMFEEGGELRIVEGELPEERIVTLAICLEQCVCGALGVEDGSSASGKREAR